MTLLITDIPYIHLYYKCAALYNPKLVNYSHRNTENNLLLHFVQTTCTFNQKYQLSELLLQSPHSDTISTNKVAQLLQHGLELGRVVRGESRSEVRHEFVGARLAVDTRSERNETANILQQVQVGRIHAGLNTRRCLLRVLRTRLGDVIVNNNRRLLVSLAHPFQ